jgi:hypothetical protein
MWAWANREQVIESGLSKERCNVLSFIYSLR